ncbi:MAG: hypothetical protein CLLPBCKN_006402 [Chroococcidiopsis cubana SAG 39.79]|uniref:hypothetical protein n=2 Tax=Chroococcidiopsis cubana TaxID=171392 RepID=UPI002AC6EF31|nr:hypothetical protein [Chroococcidiopsis cubana]MDZ4876967.1 hypothetical protein [Chroococcidiopsis cubana SAG 39.79]
MEKHYLIFIHGMGEGNPSESYEDLWRLLIKTSKLDKSDFESKFARIDTAWHTPPLSTAAQTLYDDAFPDLRQQTLNPMKYVRDFMTFFLGDVIAYVSEDVNFIRRRVWQDIWKSLQQPLSQGASYSIIAHSLGCAVAFDYVFNLWEQNELFIPKSEPIIEPVPEPTSEEFGRLQQQCRHLFTMGSPIGLFLMRKGTLWMQEYPFTQLKNPVRGDGRIWLNFWDSEDPIAYPLGKLFNRNKENEKCELVDVPVNTGFFMIDSHTRYWQNYQVAQRIMEVLKVRG